MSQMRPDGPTTVDREQWNTVLQRLRDDGFSPAESIKVTRAVLDVALGEAKRIVHSSSAWSDRAEAFEDLHEATEVAARLL